MEVTPQELRGIDVKEAFRGYQRTEVDALLERAAATIESLTDQLQRPRPVAASIVSRGVADAETIQRTLLLAQRAADDVIADAQQQARQTLQESESTAQHLVSDAEATARRIHDEERSRHEAEVVAIVARRDRLQADADALETYAREYRARVLATIEADLANLGITIEAPSARPEMLDIEPDLAPSSAESGYATTSR